MTTTVYPHEKDFYKNHGADGSGGTVNVSCLQCHQTGGFPHPKGFDTRGKVHRAMAESYEGKCLNCHADLKGNMLNYQDESEGAGCFNCHDGTLKMKWIKADEPEKTSSFKAVKKSERVPSNSSHAAKKK